MHAQHRIRRSLSVNYAGGGEWHGEITLERSGESGFGYDPVFWVAQKKCTSAQLTKEQKNALSHRGQALQQLLVKLSDNVEKAGE